MGNRFCKRTTVPVDEDVVELPITQPHPLMLSSESFSSWRKRNHSDLAASKTHKNTETKSHVPMIDLTVENGGGAAVSSSIINSLHETPLLSTSTTNETLQRATSTTNETSLAPDRASTPILSTSFSSSPLVDENERPEDEWDPTRWPRHDKVTRRLRSISQGWIALSRSASTASLISHAQSSNVSPSLHEPEEAKHESFDSVENLCETAQSIRSHVGPSEWMRIHQPQPAAVSVATDEKQEAQTRMQHHFWSWFLGCCIDKREGIPNTSVQWLHPLTQEVEKYTCDIIGALSDLELMVRLHCPITNASPSCWSLVASKPMLHYKPILLTYDPVSTIVYRSYPHPHHTKTFPFLPVSLPAMNECFQNWQTQPIVEYKYSTSVFEDKSLWSIHPSTWIREALFRFLTPSSVSTSSSTTPVSTYIQLDRLRVYIHVHIQESKTVSIPSTVETSSTSSTATFAEIKTSATRKRGRSEVSPSVESKRQTRSMSSALKVKKPRMKENSASVVQTCTPTRFQLPVFNSTQWNAITECTLKHFILQHSQRHDIENTVVMRSLLSLTIDPNESTVQGYGWCLLTCCLSDQQ